MPPRTRKSAPRQKAAPFFSPGIERFIAHLKERGVVSNVLTERHHLPELGVGSYRPKSKTFAVIASSPSEANVTAAHEAVHAILASGLPSRTGKFYNDYANKLSAFDRIGLVLPKHWSEGKVDNPLITERYDEHKAPDPFKNVIGSADDYMRNTDARRSEVVRSSIPKGQRWSGIKGKSEGGFQPDDVSEESHAYFFSDPKVIQEPMSDRLKELGMFLLDYDIPMSIVEGVLQDLSSARYPHKAYSGGSYELNELYKRHKQEKEK